MISFSIAPNSKFHSHSIGRWRRDPGLHPLMPWSQLGGNRIESAKLSFCVERLGEMWVAVTATSSPLSYANVPAAQRCGERDRVFTLLMPNTLRRIDVAGKRYWQEPGECVLTYSEDDLVGTYGAPHAAICLNIPYEIVRAWLPETEPFRGLKLGNASTTSRIISLLLLALWQTIESGDDESVPRDAASALLKLLENRCRRAAPGSAEPKRKICCEHVKAFIDSHLRDPALSVQMVAERIGVSTRYLQLLFADEGECVSDYIKRERLRGCLLDLRDSDRGEESITEIAFSWGFNSAAHFSSSFRQAFGLSPRDYRGCDALDLTDSPLAQADGPLVHALVALGRSKRGVFESRSRHARAAAAY